MPSQEVSEPQPAEVVVMLQPRHITEIRRGLLHRMSVANSNLNDRSLTDAERARWLHMRDACWEAYSLLTKAVAKYHTAGATP